MPCTDRYHLVLSTACEAAAERYRAGVDLMLSAWPGAAAELDQALAHDPQFAMACAARARLHAMVTEAAQARQMIARAQHLVARHGTERERSHVQVLALAIHGPAPQALASALQHIGQWPQDILVFGLTLGAFGLLAFSGMRDHDQARVELCERHARHFAENDWWFLTYRGWAHAENGSVVLGRALTQRALAQRPANANAMHALAHALFEAGANVEAERLIAYWLPGYDRRGVLHGHLAWHAALAALERGDAQAALQVYTSQVAPSVSHGLPLNVISDGASLLWRLRAYGHAVADGLHDELASFAGGHFQQAGFAFADVHMAMLAAASGDSPALQARIDALDALQQAGKLPAGPLVPTLCRALQYFAQARYLDCARLLEPLAGEVVRIGGSGAQREVIEDTWLVALMRAGQAPRAAALLHARLQRRPSPRDRRWQAQLEAGAPAQGAGA